VKSNSLYLSIELGLVWGILADRVPELQKQIERIVDEARENRS
jgi:uncharacterized protein with HEPN domain